ncbi:MAG: S8 family serine peptidase [Gemmataceae bacterium]|nr:S8 family serine peptidase [Planctomycetia bacterium]MBX3399370.1 S8 family serine peptidase [Gemmataceae bacterium]
MPPAVPPRPQRVVVRFKPDVNLPYNASAIEKLQEQAGHAWDEIAVPHPGTQFGVLYPRLDPLQLKSYFQLTPTVGNEPFRFTSDYAILCPPNVSAAAVAERIGAWPSVRSAYVQAGAAPPPASVHAIDDRFCGNQGYLDATPVGIGARWVWENTPANGSGVGLVDLEQGWILNHEDLLSPTIPTPIHGENIAYHNHGLQVLGVVRASDNDKGIIGIAPQCDVRVASPWNCVPPLPCADHSDVCAHDHNFAQAILAAVGAMSKGDVLLLEAQWGTAGGGACYASPPWVPVEVDDINFDAIRLAVSKGIVVVEAAGNGSQDLDAFAAGSKQILNPSAGKGVFRDSGAILVGAAVSVNPTSKSPLRSPYFSTNYGSRVDCYAWGQGVYTTLQKYGSTALNEYGDTFGETSASSAIVAGAAVLLQSWKILGGGAPYSPLELRAKLANRTPLVNTDSANGYAVDKIGVMPNLEAIINSEIAALPMFHHLPRRHHDDAARLFNDPHGTPILQPLREHLAKLDPAERDLAVALAALDLADQAERKSIAKRLRKTARRILKDARKKPKRDR